MADASQAASVRTHSQSAAPCLTPHWLPAGKSERITITNDKGRLSQEEIDRMVQEAEEFADQDKKVKGRVDAKNALETYVYNLRSTMDDKLGEKLAPDDRDTVRLLACLLHCWCWAHCLGLGFILGCVRLQTSTGACSLLTDALKAAACDHA